jgi:predicted PurR-regulated permease PerM
MAVSNLQKSLRARPQPRDDVVQLAVRLGLLGFLIYWSFVLVRPFIPLLVWSVVLTVALYPVYDWLTARLGGRRGLSAAIITLLSLLVVLGPASWLGVSLVEALRSLSEQLNVGSLAVPAPPDGVKNWPLVGDRIYEAWHLASTNLDSAIAQITPQVKPMAGTVLGMAGNVGKGLLTFLVAVVLAGFLFVPGRRLVAGTKLILAHVVPQRSDEFIALAGNAIRTISRGVVGIALLQALLIGLGFKVVGVPAAGLLAFLVLMLGIVQVGSAIIVIPVVVWGWFTWDTMTALLFTAYVVPVSLIDNVLKPIVMGHGLTTPVLVIFIGVIGGTLAHGVVGLFVGPIILAVAWELLAAWMRDERNQAVAAEVQSRGEEKPAVGAR